MNLSGVDAMVILILGLILLATIFNGIMLWAIGQQLADWAQKNNKV